jgi:DNA-binding transcriptional MerR regulator
MDGGTLYSIGDVARRTGLTVKTIRFYSDCGIVAPANRNPAGHRLYDMDAVARLDLVRTLRDLGLDLATIRKVLDRELSLAEVATAHAKALAVQIRTLRLRHAVLTSVAERRSTPEEMGFMHKLAELSEEERRRLIGDFLDATFGGVRANPDFAGVIAGVMRSMTPELPDSPGAEQIEAWADLAELSQDPNFRISMRRMVEDEATEHARSDTRGLHRGFVAFVRDQATPALKAGIDPASTQADAIVAALTARYAHVSGSPGNAELLGRLITRLERVNDPRRERYLQLLAVINGWEDPDSLMPALDWSIQAVSARVLR